MANPAPTPSEQDFWSQSRDALLAQAGSTAQGLADAEAAARLAKFGPNMLSAKKQVTVAGLFLNQVKSPIILILLFATLLSAYLSDWLDALIILLIILGSAGLSVAQEYSASHAAEKLQSQVRAKASVLRGGQARSIPAAEVVPGDVVVLSAGSLVPADGVVLEAKDFFLNQAVLTGETFPVEKTAEPSAPGAAL
ncbi:MAG TPA: cation-transporting P-type ATPase, partial [Anaerolinea sp.]|nr:cation-transporting P-type ATPase [Anaerolinea sp.]